MKAKNESKSKITKANAVTIQKMVVSLFLHIWVVKLCPLQDFQLNAAYMSAWRCQALQDDICKESYSCCCEYKSEASRRAWFQPLLASDVTRTNEEGDTRRSRGYDGVLLNLNSIWCLPGHQHTSFLSSNTTGCTTYALFNTQKVLRPLALITSKSHSRHFGFTLALQCYKTQAYIYYVTAS